MKKLIIALFSLILLTPNYANAATEFHKGYLGETASGAAYVDPWGHKYSGDERYLSTKGKVLEVASEAFFADKTNRANAVAAYLGFVKENNNKGVKPQQLWDVCTAGGLDIKNAADKDTCLHFAYAIRPYFERPCTDRGRLGQGICDKNFKDINVVIRSATAIAKAYMETKGRAFVVCSDDINQASNDDYVACRPVRDATNSGFYEFQFDDVKESWDGRVEQDTRIAIARIARLGSKTGSPSCEEIDKVAQKLGWRAKKNSSGGCNIYSAKITEASQLVNEYAGKIDNMVFSEGKDQSQVQASSSLDELIKGHCVAQLAKHGETVSSFKCSETHFRWDREWTYKDEDVLTCHVNGKRVDFVFDDLTQTNVLWGQDIIDGSLQGMGCREVGGIFDGKQCGDLSKEQCEQVAKLNLSNCPGCKQAYWDEKNKMCALPASAIAADTKQNIQIAVRVGGAAAALVVTVATAGTGTAAIVMITAAGVATTAAITSEAVKASQSQDATEWFQEMNRIETPEQAKDFLQSHLDTIMGANHLSPTQRNALDEMLGRVINNKTSDDYFYELTAGCVETGVDDGDLVMGSVLNTDLPSCRLNPKNGKNTKSDIIQIADTVEFIAGVVMAVTGLAQTVKTTMTNRVTNITEKLDDLKGTGWIREGTGKKGVWHHQQTGEIRDVLPEGVPGWNPNPNLSGGGRWHGHMYGNGTRGSFTKHSDMIRYITENYAETVITTAWRPNVLGSAAGVYYAVDGASSLGDQNQPRVDLQPRDQEQPAAVMTQQEQSAPVTTQQQQSAPVTTQQQQSVPVTTQQEQPAPVTTQQEQPAPETTQQEQPAPETTQQEQPAPVTTQQEQSAPVHGVSAYTPASATPVRDIKPHEVKNNGAKTALIATAAIAGTIGAGWLIGGLVGKDKKDDDKKSSSVVEPDHSDLERLMQNAGGTVGVYADTSLRLVPLPTTVNSYAPIVTINGQAVVVVDYRGMRLPYYMNAGTKRWEPLLGIGVNGGWFNVYPDSSQTGIMVIDAIAAELKRNLLPSIVVRYVNGVNGGISFPMAGSGAYPIINAEFKNGVVQTNNGVMSQSDRLLYDSNYNLIRAKLQ